MTLELMSLPQLSSFCSIHAFKFPSLEKLIVKDCPNMAKFCKQVTTTAPNLQVLKGGGGGGGEEEKNCYWKGDLNATILKMFILSVRINFYIIQFTLHITPILMILLK